MEYEKIVEINQHSLEMGGFYTKRCTELAKICKSWAQLLRLTPTRISAQNIGRLDTALKMLEEIGFDEKACNKCGLRKNNREILQIKF